MKQRISVSIDFDREIIYGETEIENLSGPVDLVVLSIPPLPNSSTYNKVTINGKDAPFKCYYSMEENTPIYDLLDEKLNFREIYGRVLSSTPSLLVIHNDIIGGKSVENVIVSFSYRLGVIPFNRYNWSLQPPNRTRRNFLSLFIGYRNKNRWLSWYPTIPYGNNYIPIEIELNVKTLYNVISSLRLISKEYNKKGINEVENHINGGPMQFIFSGKIYPHQLSLIAGDIFIISKTIKWVGSDVPIQLQLATMQGYESMLESTCQHIPRVLESCLMKQSKALKTALSSFLQLPPFSNIQLLFSPLFSNISWHGIQIMSSRPRGMTSSASMTFEEALNIMHYDTLGVSPNPHCEDIYISGGLAILPLDCLFTSGDVHADLLILEKKILIAEAIYKILTDSVQIKPELASRDYYLKIMLQQIFLDSYIANDFGRGEQQLVRWAKREQFALIVQLYGDPYPLSITNTGNDITADEIEINVCQKLKCLLVSLAIESLISESQFIPESFLAIRLSTFLGDLLNDKKSGGSERFWQQFWSEIICCYINAWNAKPQNFSPENQLPMSLCYNHKPLQQSPEHSQLFRLEESLLNIQRMHVLGTGCPLISLTLLLHLQRKGTAMDYFTFHLDQTPLEPPKGSAALAAGLSISNDDEDCINFPLDPIDLVGRDGNFTLGFGYLGQDPTEFSIGGGLLWDNIERLKDRYSVLSGEDFAAEMVDFGLYSRKIITDPVPISGSRLFGHPSHISGYTGVGLLAPSNDFCKIWPMEISIDVFEDDGIRRQLLKVGKNDKLPKSFQLNPRAERGRKRTIRELDVPRENETVTPINKSPFIGFSSETDGKLIEWMRNYVTTRLHPEYRQLDNRSLVAKVCSKGRLPVLWIRVDPHFSLVGRLRRCQSPSMWEQQLLADNDIIGQMEAASRMGGISDLCGCVAAMGAVRSLIAAMSQHLWHPAVRIRAAFSLVQIYNSFSRHKRRLVISRPKNNFLGIKTSNVMPANVSSSSGQSSDDDDDDDDEFGPTQTVVMTQQSTTSHDQNIITPLSQVDNVLTQIIKGFSNYFVLHHTKALQTTTPVNKIGTWPMVMDNLEWPTEVRFFANYLKALCLFRDFHDETPIEILELIMRFLDASCFISSIQYPILATHLFTSISALKIPIKGCFSDEFEGFKAISPFNIFDRILHLLRLDKLPESSRSCALLTRVYLKSIHSIPNLYSQFKIRDYISSTNIDPIITTFTISLILKMVIMGKIVCFKDVGLSSTFTTAEEEDRIVKLGMGFLSALHVIAFIKDWIGNFDIIKPFKLLMEICNDLYLFNPNVFSTFVLDKKNKIDIIEVSNHFQDLNHGNVVFLGWSDQNRPCWDSFLSLLKANLLSKVISNDQSFRYILAIYEFFNGREDHSQKGQMMDSIWTFLRRYGRGYTNSPLLANNDSLPNDWQNVALMAACALKDQRYVDLSWTLIQTKLRNHSYGVPMEFKADVAALIRNVKNDPGINEFEKNFEAVWNVVISSFKKGVGRI